MKPQQPTELRAIADDLAVLADTDLPYLLRWINSLWEIENEANN